LSEEDNTGGWADECGVAGGAIVGHSSGVSSVEFDGNSITIVHGDGRSQSDGHGDGLVAGVGKESGGSGRATGVDGGNYDVGVSCKLL
jgi:hypothetical protein